MAKRIWLYLINPFLVVLGYSFSKVMQLSTFHDSKLSAATAPALVALYTAYHPLHLALAAAYSGWGQYKDIQKGSTAGATQTRQQLTTKINEWDRGVQAADILPGSPDYIMIFPNGHGPFTGGKQQNIIAAVTGLSAKLANYPILASVKASVDTYLGVLTGTNSAKNTAKGTTDQYADALMAASVAACKKMFVNLGQMYTIFNNSPEDAEQYFDMTILRDEPQTVFSKTVQAGEIYPVAKRGLEPAAQIRFKNTGTVPLILFLTAVRGHDHGTLYETIQPGEELTYSASELGTPPTDNWLSVHNETMADGTFELTLL